jgi:predicted acylesterase/phospholipase RssA
VVFRGQACEEQIPQTITVAVPFRVAQRAADGPALAQQVAAAFRTREGRENVAMKQLLGLRQSTVSGEAQDPCAGRRRLQVNLALGSDYQVLDWLGQSQVDAGILPWMSRYLLQRDEVELLPVRPEELLAGAPEELWRRPVRPLLAVRRWDGETWRVEADPQAWLERYREELWCRALAEVREAGPQAELEGARQRCPQPSESSAVYRAVMPSHFSSGGFVAPLASTGRWLQERWQALGLDEAAATKAMVEAALWRGFFHDLRLTLDHDPLTRLRGEAGDRELLDFEIQAAQERVELLFSDGAALGEDFTVGEGAIVEPEPRVEELPSDRLVVRQRSGGALSPEAGSNGAEAPWWLSARDALRPVSVPAGLPLPSADVGPMPSEAGVGVDAVPGLLAAFLEPVPFFGVRTFDFTADEALRLTRLHGSGEADDELSLVLPGGGVKAAYQSVLLDTFYGRRALINRWAGERREGRAQVVRAGAETGNSLVVDHVVGTSGGSLIGFFVARLGERGPFNLSEVLWRDSTGRPLTSAAIFGWTDLLRWLSLVAVFLCLCALLAVRRRPLREAADSGDQAREADGLQEPVDLFPAARWRMWAILLPILLLAPLLTSWLSGESAREHVPVMEGLLYAVLVWMVMLADQCLVMRDPGDAASASDYRPEPWISWRALIFLGAGLVAVPLVLRSQVSQQVGLGEAPFGLAYVLTITLVGLLASVATHWRLQAASAGNADFPDPGKAVLWFAGCAVVVPLVLVGVPMLRVFIKAPPVFFAGLVLVVVFLAVYLYLARGREGEVEGAPDEGGSRRGTVTFFGAMLVGCALVLLITAPGEEHAAAFASLPLMKVLFLPSGLGIFPGSMVFMVGALILGLGLMLWLHGAHAAYRLEGIDDFLVALFVVLFHGLVVYLVVFALSLIPRLQLSLLELTGRFWLVLLGVALVLGLVLLEGVRRSRHQGWFPDTLRRGVGYLNQRHPNGTILSWRFLRLAAIAVLFLGWWNLVVAPALYGNQAALSFLRGARSNFEAEHRQLFSELESEHREPRFTALFVTPANELETDGTRFFAFAPAPGLCPTVGQEMSSGGSWQSYWEAEAETLPWKTTAGPGDGLGCEALSGAERDFLTDVIFASGSPFPVFSAHRVQLPRGQDEMFLVDGGYSNNVPVEAARRLDADRVLILRSSHPLGHLSKPGWVAELMGWMAEVPGPLVQNIGRLPAFLFERSQQTDRRSSRELLVVSMAPRREHHSWPSLVDFRTPVVERLKCLAQQDLGLITSSDCRPYLSSEEPPGARRIALVESWGRPEVKLSETVPEQPLFFSRE